MDLTERSWTLKQTMILGFPPLWIIYSMCGEKRYTCIFGRQRDELWQWQITVKQRFILFFFQWAEPQQWQHWILNSLSHKGTPMLFFFLVGSGCPFRKCISQPLLHNLGHVTSSCWWGWGYHCNRDFFLNYSMNFITFIAV